jgi:hypothetical protein
MFVWPLKLFGYLLTHPKVGIPIAVAFLLFVLLLPKASP